MPLLNPFMFNAAAGAFEIEYACDFDDNDYIHWTPSSAGNRQIWTWSVWFKKSENSASNYIFGGGTSGSQYYIVGFGSSDKLEIDSTHEYHLRTNATYTDTGAWIHLVLGFDSTQGTAADRLKIYINGTQNTDLTVITSYPDEDLEDTWINNTVAQAYQNVTWASGMNMHLADINFVDGAQLAPTAFGETSGSDWIPIDPSPTYGSNGYRLEFKQTGTGQDASGIGADTSGEDNHFATVNLVSGNRITDTPTNPS